MPKTHTKQCAEKKREMVQSGCGKGTVTTNMTNHSISHCTFFQLQKNRPLSFHSFSYKHSMKSVKQNSACKKTINGSDTKERLFSVFSSCPFSSKHHHSLGPSQPHAKMDQHSTILCQYHRNMRTKSSMEST